MKAKNSERNTARRIKDSQSVYSDMKCYFCRCFLLWILRKGRVRQEFSYFKSRVGREKCVYQI